MPAKDLKELIAWLKANPDRASAGTAGVGGSTGQVAGVLFQNVTGTRFGFVPYRGAGPAMQDLVAGQIDLMFDVRLLDFDVHATVAGAVARPRRQ